MGCSLCFLSKVWEPQCYCFCFPLDRMATPYKCTKEDGFKTPNRAQIRSSGSSSSGGAGTPITIPASPFMKKLGCGTGVNVYLMNRCQFWVFYSSVTFLSKRCSSVWDLHGGLTTSIVYMCPCRFLVSDVAQYNELLGMIAICMYCRLQYTTLCVV